MSIQEGFDSGIYTQNGNEELSRVQLRNMFIEKARNDIYKKLGEWRSEEPKSNIAEDRAKNKE
ncbi:hypothetical protein Lalb_Chr25g0281631 [Lupinus albus]|uniref:Uncharacterized protein n=1 Tax=Lupinus albus TaxID=3870 RepID=A0A6A4N2E6_LUPAL|nr:hypothetical protein Lalb_Chr25g0281631 [Lupinus albus]